jgi:hypothetical protein
MSNLYMRHVEVTAGDRKFSSKEFTIYFDIPFDDGPDINIADVDIYNLSGSTIAALQKGDHVVVNAGYEGDIGAVLVGTAQLVYTDWQGVDKTTQLTVADGHDNWMKTKIKKTYKEGITGKQILEDLIPKTGLKKGALKLPLNMKYDGAKTIDGAIGKTIVEIAKDCNAKVHVNRGKIYIREKTEGDEIAFVLDKGHGLIGSPTPVENEEKYNVVERVKKDGKYVNEYVEKTRIRKGYKITSLLNFNFTTDVVLKVASKTANGLFRIEKGKHVSNGSSFYTEMEVYPR